MFSNVKNKILKIKNIILNVLKWYLFIYKDYFQLRSKSIPCHPSFLSRNTEIINDQNYT
jgi:hypothetical protein